MKTRSAADENKIGRREQGSDGPPGVSRSGTIKFIGTTGDESTAGQLPTNLLTLFQLNLLLPGTDTAVITE